MNPAISQLPGTIQIGCDLILVADGGWEWSLAADDPQFEQRKAEWDQFDAATCRPVDFQALLGRLEKSA